ncbi:MAG: hypothetical protein ACOZNI_32175 [Myxococcota bacterium]
MSDSPHDFSYPTEGARTLLRSHVPAHLGREARSPALRALIEDARALFDGYGFEANWFDGPSHGALRRWWVFSRPGKDRRVVLHIVRGDLEVRTVDDGNETACSERPEILFDPTSGIWVGPVAGTRDLARNGAPLVHLSALEELTRFILEILREGP